MSIRARLLWVTLLVTLLPVLLLVARFVQERQLMIQADTGRLVLAAQRRAEIIADKMQATTQLLYGLDRARDLSTDDVGACSAFLSRVRDGNPQYTGILTIKPDGSLFCDSLRTGRHLDLRDRAYFKAALAARDGVVVEPAFGRLTGSSVLQIAHPVRSAEGKLEYVLLASLDLQKVIDQTRANVAGRQLLLLDTKGVVMATTRTDSAREQPGSSVASTAIYAFAASGHGGGTAEIVGPDGQLGVWALADSEVTAGARLYVLGSVPKELLVASANMRFRQDLAVLAVAALAVLAAVWAVTETAIRRQIERISNMAKQLASGDLAARIAPPLPRGELGTLMSELNRTAESLEQQRSDIAELNARLRVSQRLEAVGQLTGGVAHDFNNLLTVVMGNAELLTELNAGQHPHKELAEMIGTAARRGAELTQRLLAFARKQALDPKAVDLNQLVASIDPLLRRTLGEHIEIEWVRAAGLWPALVDQGQLENAVLNLCLNARDAMPGGGRLTLETANARLDAEYAGRNLEVRAGPYVMLAVSDTGEGIAPHHLQRVFEPFFTTKDTGKGTGLGLAMVYGFVKQSGGHVSIYSELGQGTTVKVYLPRAQEQAAAAAEASSEPAVVGGRETILLVEDDEGVRRYAAEQLRSFGYRVVEAADGLSALAIVEQRSDLDLLFTDVVMPGGMNGRALADAARRVRPDLKVLYTSGYTENAIVHHGRLDAGAFLLTKPYRRIELDRAIRQALAGNAE